MFEALAPEQKSRFLEILLGAVKQLITGGLLDQTMFARLQAVPNQLPGPGSLAASIMSHSRAQASDLQRQKDALKMTCAGPGVPRQRRAQASENYTS